MRRSVFLSRLFLLSILVVVGLGASGCRAKKATDASSELDQRASGAPATPAASGGRTQPESAVQGEPEGLGSAAADAPDAALAGDKRPLVVCFGDSLTAGFGTDPGQSYPDFLQRDLDAKGYKYRVVNEGVSGNTTKDGLARVSHVAALHPAVTVVEFGGNDGLRGLPIADSRANLDEIVSTLKASGTKVVLAGITLPPDYGQDYIRDFNQTYVVLGAKYKVPMLPFLLEGAFGQAGMMQADRTHATAKGNEVVARNVLGLVQPLLKR